LRTLDTPDEPDVRGIAAAALGAPRRTAALARGPWLIYAGLSALVAMAVATTWGDRRVFPDVPPPAAAMPGGADLEGPMFTLTSPDGTVWMGNIAEPSASLPDGTGFVIIEGGSQ
ncbi:MAG: hypothetical protein Q7V01_15830, partial [Vicinamibacterales bacterium]|nr:hypothetical protein [Vicinamibacterales bacterium]